MILRLGYRSFFYFVLFIMITFLRKFKLYLVNQKTPTLEIRQYLRAASIFLCWYHRDIDTLTNKDLDTFMNILIRKHYKEHEIQTYKYVISILSSLLHKKISIEQEKKPHHEDVVLISRCTNSSKKRQSMAGMVN